MSSPTLPATSSLSRQRLAVLLLAVVALTPFILAPGAFALILLQLMVDGPLLLAWIGAGYGLGSLVALLLRGRRSFQPSASPVLKVVTQIAIGLGLLSLLTLLLGVLGVLKQPTTIAVLLLANVLTTLDLYRNHETIAGCLRGSADRSLFALLPAMAIIGATVLAALVIPWILWGDEPHAYDVVSYHFQLPREWLERGRIDATPHNVFGYFPLNVEMHYLFAMTVRGSAAAGMYLAQLMHAAMMALTLLAIYGAVNARRESVETHPDSSLRAGPHPDPLSEGKETESSRLPACAAVVFAAAFPWLLMLGGVGYNECGVTLFTTLALAWTLRQRYLLAGVCAGFAAGCKITSLPTLVALLPLLVLVEGITRKRFEWKGVALLLLGSIAALSPWLVRTAVLSGGNPVFPIAAKMLGAGPFDAGRIERFDVAHAARTDQQTFSARASALHEQVLRDFKFGSLRVGDAGLPILLTLALVAFALRVRDRAAWLLVAFIAGNLIIWLFTTHLQGRFLVPIIPAAALLVGKVERKAWPWVVLSVSLVSMPFTFASVVGRLVAPPAQSGIAYSEPSIFLPEPLLRLLQQSDRPVYLVGDARAFLYPVPSTRLHYRTVFNVPADKPFREAWLGDSPSSDAIVVVAPSELERFEKTYRNLPKMPDEWRGRPMFVTDSQFKMFIPLE